MTDDAPKTAARHRWLRWFNLGVAIATLPALPLAATASSYLATQRILAPRPGGTSFVSYFGPLHLLMGLVFLTTILLCVALVAGIVAFVREGRRPAARPLASSWVLFGSNLLLLVALGLDFAYLLAVGAAMTGSVH